VAGTAAAAAAGAEYTAAAEVAAAAEWDFPAEESRDEQKGLHSYHRTQQRGQGGFHKQCKTSFKVVV